jgi:hypothetical protein
MPNVILAAVVNAVIPQIELKAIVTPEEVLLSLSV